jgi:hypothetical protein
MIRDKGVESGQRRWKIGAGNKSQLILAPLLIYKLLVAFLLLFSSVSFADSYPPVQIYMAINIDKGGFFGSFSTGQDACDAAASTWTGGGLTFVPPDYCNSYFGWAMPFMTCPAGGLFD